MKICERHHIMCEEAINNSGLAPLAAKSRLDAEQRVSAFVDGGLSLAAFEPFISLSDHWFNQALRCGGVGLLCANPTGENDGHYCPICEFEKHSEDFDAMGEITAVAQEMATWARQHHLIPMVQ
jgi:hypothetical protein